MIIAALCYLTGIMLAQQLPDISHPGYLICLAPALGLAILRRYWGAMFVLFGMLWAIGFSLIRLHDRLPESLEGIDLKVTGRIAGLPDVQEKSVRFDFRVSESTPELPSLIRLTWHQPNHPVEAGQTWTFTVKLKRPHGTVNPGGFDYERWLFMEGIGATGYIRTGSPPQLIKAAPLADIDGLRQRLVNRLSNRLSNSGSLALIQALTIGDGSLITQEQWDLFRKTGTTHLVVISGSHIGLIAGLAYFIALKGLALMGLLRWPPPRVAAVVSLAAGVFYAILAGFAVPTQRAAIMLAVGMIAVICRRQARPFNTLAIALFAVLLADPLAVLSPGFWLSFLAVGIIILAIAGRLKKPSLFAGAIKLNWVTSLGLAPLLLLFFQQVSLIAPLANLLAVPIISLIVLPLSLIGLALLPISSAAGLLFLHPADYVLQGLSWLLLQLSALPLATLQHAAPSDWAQAFALPGILLLLAPLGTPARWLGGIMLLPLVFTTGDSERPAPGEFKLTLLDVGQGLAATVQTTSHWLVYDAGPKFSPDSDMGRSVVLPFLSSQGAEKIDTLIISHGDNDHIGGASSILNALPTDKLLTSAPDRLASHSPAECRAGQSWQWDNVDFTMLGPGEIKPEAGNNNSCVLKIQSAHGNALLTGDIEAPAEAWLVEHYPKALIADVLVAPHHGSKTSSTAVFLDAVQPGFVLIPSGYRNQFGHPHPTVLDRYQTHHARWLSSANSGAILVNAVSNQITVEAYRQIDQRYWRSVNPQKNIIDK